MSEDQVKQLLTRRLGLDHPTFRLELIGAKVAGSVVSATFQGKSSPERQRLIWDALDAELGPESVHQVGTILSYTPQEWDD